MTDKDPIHEYFTVSCVSHQGLACYYAHAATMYRERGFSVAACGAQELARLHHLRAWERLAYLLGVNKNL